MLPSHGATGVVVTVMLWDAVAVRLLVHVTVIVIVPLPALTPRTLTVVPVLPPLIEMRVPVRTHWRLLAVPLLCVQVSVISLPTCTRVGPLIEPAQPVGSGAAVTVTTWSSVAGSPPPLQLTRIDTVRSPAITPVTSIDAVLLLPLNPVGTVQV